MNKRINNSDKEEIPLEEEGLNAPLMEESFSPISDEEPTNPFKEGLGDMLQHPFFISTSGLLIDAAVTSLGGNQGLSLFLGLTFVGYANWFGSTLTKKTNNPSEDKETSAGNIDDLDD